MTIAELHGKFDPQASTDVSRMEDTLTDSVFSALRYLPADGALRQFVDLVTAGAGPDASDYHCASVSFWPHLQSHRTPSGYIEPDVVITVGDVVICVEAKFKAGFGLYRDPGDGLGPLHQLAIQGEALSKNPPASVPDARLFVVAVTDAADSPELAISTASKDLKRLGLDDGTVTLGWMGWWQIGEMLKGLTNLTPNERALRDDVIAFLIQRKVASVYEPISPDDWAVMAQASGVADARVFPAVAVFQRNLAQKLKDDDIVWGHPLHGVQLFSTTSLDRAAAWFPGRVSLPWWPNTWGRLSESSRFGLGLYTCFDFTDPAIEIGFVATPRSASLANQAWEPLADSLAGQLGVHAADGLEIAFSKNVITPPTASVALSDIGVTWLRTNLHNLTGCLLLRRRLQADANVALVHAAVLEILDIVDKTPFLVRLLELSAGSSGGSGQVLANGSAGGEHLPAQ